MDRPPVRHRETQELIDRFRRNRARRRRGLVFALIVIGVVIAAGVALGAAYALGARGTGAETSTTTSMLSESGAGTTAAGGGASTTVSPGNEDPSAGPARPGPSPGSSISAGPTATAASTTTTARQTTTTARPTTTTARPTTTTKAPAPAGGAGSQLVVVIDPGHQAKGNSDLEPIGPGSSEKKAKVSSGTRGVATGIPESELVLVVGLKLRDALQAEGVKVVMTRTSQDVNISNAERAQIANNAGADLFVRVHADGASNASTRGIHVLYPTSIPGWTDDIASASKKAAAIAQKRLIEATAAVDRGITARGDMTGFNWSDVPVILPEIGFMTNPDEDRLLATAAYQDKIARALAQAILEYLGAK